MRRATLTIIGIALLAAACTTVDEAADSADDYLATLRPIARDVNLVIDSVGKVFEGDFESQDLLFLALADSRAANDLAIARDRAGRLDPGPEYIADHERYLTFLDSALARARDLDGALAVEDAATAAAVAFDLEVSAGLSFVGLGPEACDAATFNQRLCRSPASQDAYGTALHPHLLRLTAAYLPGIADLPAGLTNREQRDLIAAIGPTMISVLEEALEGIRDLQPPPEVAQDHGLMVAYLEEAAAAHRRSTDAASLGDLMSMAAGHRAAQRAFCTTGPALSREGRRFMAVFFLDELGICND